LRMEGFDTLGATSGLNLRTNWAGTPNSLVTGRDGVGRGVATTAITQNDALKFTIGGTESTIIVGFAMYKEAGASVADDFLVFYEGTRRHCGLRLGSSDGPVSLYRSTTLVETSDYAFTPDIWNYVEIEVQVADSGHLTLRVNGAEVYSFTGVDTKNAGTGFIDTIYFMSGAFGRSVRYDDIYALDTTGSAPYNTFLGDCRIETLRPNAAGDSTDFTPSAGSNHQNVDDSPGPDGDTTYNESSTVAHKDLYGLADLSEAYDTIYAVMPEIYARKDDAGDRTINTVLKSDSTESDGGAAGLSTSYAYLIGPILTEDPDTTAAWDATGVDAVQVGLEIAAESS
jgi:hypothetical protein